MMHRHLHYSSPYRELLEPGALDHLDGDERAGAERALERLAPPPDYGSAGVQYVTHAPVVAAHRDSDILDRSNLEVAREMLEPFEEHYSAGVDEEPDVTYGSAGHWLVGWVESVDVRPFMLDERGEWRLTPAWLEALEILDALEDYPVLDEEHYSNLEYEETTEYVARELDGLEGVWTERAFEELYSGSYDTRVEDLDLELVCHSAWHAVAEPFVESARAWLRLREVGTGQMTTDGETVTVPPAPSLEELASLIDPLDVESSSTSRLLELLELEPPREILRAVERADTYGELLELAELLVEALAPA